MRMSPAHNTSADMLNTVFQEQRRNSFDHVVIETTGLADPQPIIMTFRGHPVSFQPMQHVIAERWKLFSSCRLHMHRHAAFC